MEILEIKSRLSLETVLNHYDITPDRNHRLRCPFHEDKTPSMQVYPRTNTWTCFSGNCSAGSGDVIDFIMKKEGITKHGAILKAKEMLGYNGSSVVPANVSTPRIPALTQKRQCELLQMAFTHFTHSLNVRPKEAIRYLEQRGLDHQCLPVGYDAGTFYKGKNITTELKKDFLSLGLLKPARSGHKDSYYSRFNGCIVFPLVGRNNNIVSFYGRHCGRDEHHYLEGQHRGLFPGYPDPGTSKLILTEAVIDAATLLQLPGVVDDFSVLSLYGVNGFTGDCQGAITELENLREVILFFDGDSAGRGALETIAPRIQKIRGDLLITTIDTPEGEDVNSLYQNHGPQVFPSLLDKRKPFSSVSIEKEVFVNKTSEADDSGRVGKLKENPDFLFFETDLFEITLWGGVDIHSVNRLRATLYLRCKKDEHAGFRDTVDLYSHSLCERFISQASEKLEMHSGHISQVIAALTRELEAYRQGKREEKRQSEQKDHHQGVESFSTEQMRQASAFLKSSDLTQKTYALFKNLGMVGLQDNAALLFFIFLTRLFAHPLHAIVMGSSGSGKTHLLQGVARVVPRQSIHVTTSLSENTLYYTPKDFLKHKILLQEDLDGAYNALLPLRELMSNQEISRFSTKTNSRTGDSKQVYLHVEGPVCVAGATTRNRIYEDNANRSFLIQIEETPDQEQQVLEYQGRVAAGLVDLHRHEKTINLLKACQLIIKPMEVVIPFADKLELPPSIFKKMRTKNHYLTLIKAITLWNQKSRRRGSGPEGSTHLVATPEDARWANYLCRDSLLRKSDELGGKTRNFFEALKNLLKETQDGSPVFYAKDVRKTFRLHPMQLKRFLDELEGRGFIKCLRRSHHSGNEYEITTWDDYERLKDGVNMLDQLVENLMNEKVKTS